MGQIRMHMQLFRYKTQIILLLFSEWKQLLRNRGNGLAHNKIIFILLFYYFVNNQKNSLISEKWRNEQMNHFSEQFVR